MATTSAATTTGAQEAPELTEEKIEQIAESKIAKFEQFMECEDIKERFYQISGEDLSQYKLETQKEIQREMKDTLLRKPKLYNILKTTPHGTNLLQQLCPFCNPNSVAEGYICSSKRNHFQALYNIRPVFRGHVLIVPKDHISKIEYMTEEQMLDYQVFTRDIVLALKKNYKTHSINFIMQEGKYSGQSVQHLHLHLLPRQQGDLNKDQEWMEYFQKHEHLGRVLSLEKRREESENIANVYKQIIQHPPTLQ